MPERWEPLRQLLQDGVNEGVYTAALALVGLRGQLLWEGAAGRVSREPEAEVTTPRTVFDLASLTKPLAVAPALMVLAARGEVKLHATLGEILPHAWLPSDKRPLTVESLLAHRAGLPAWMPFYEEVLAAPPPERPTVLPRLAAAAPLAYEPDTATLYSDLGFMLLQAVVEKCTGTDLNTFCRLELYRPLGRYVLGFKPRQEAGGEALSYAATEPGLITGRNPLGEVHDENAWAAGGVAGHAGLFGRGIGVFQMLSVLYRAYQGKHYGLFDPDLAQGFLTPVAPDARALGFDVPSVAAAECSCGRFFSPTSVGHTGFTGTSFWLDLELGQMVVLLTNRVHLGRDDKAKIKAFRPHFHEAASRALGFEKSFRD